jgi:transposase
MRRMPPALVVGPHFRPQARGRAMRLRVGRVDHHRIADRGYDADWFREALKDKGIRPCIPGRKSRGKAVRYDKRRYKRLNRIEIMFGRLKDWRRIDAI